jgi:hypothetical protein
MYAFLQAYPGMALAPATGGPTVFSGGFSFEASWDGVDVKDTYDLRIEVASYPEVLPRVFETGGRIPHQIDAHVFEASGRLCLGSELRLRQILGPTLDLLFFADRCIVPFLFATTHRASAGRFILGELAHGHAGLYDDYQAILGVTGEDAVGASLRILATKPNAADRHPCPCGCGKRLVLCEFRNRIEQIRRLAPRKVFQQMAQVLRGTTTSGKKL